MICVLTLISPQIELVLTLEEQLPECVHKRVIQTQPILVHPNTINSALHCSKLVLQCVCICCSAVFFNTNHLRYWMLIYKPADTKPSRRFGEVPRAIEKAHFNPLVEVNDFEVYQSYCISQFTGVNHVYWVSIMLSTPNIPCFNCLCD